ncbi:DUF2868 domain-containing protein [Halioglobus maricola]|uniref:DUF2868 domain-containing protein n=1 Tax=Halioglobus maricola TaxID=2601894 RepID=A0A5P9NMX0_9GAMM|nr:DUF2868 domain-containing protein [Halioglobus maricola]QFU76614.1 DUF2868 domain-containing protein [Halioglobus maricola]
MWLYSVKRELPMAAEGSSPRLQDLYALGEQMAADREDSLAELRRRDHEIGQDCLAQDDAGRLLYWLRCVHPGDRETSGGIRAETMAVALRLSALLFGALAMAGFLLASKQALVNVLLFLLVFVVLQLLASLVAAITMMRSLRGSPPAVSPLNPARLITRRALPDARYLSENSGAVRLLLLRYGQEFGALFTAGAMVALFGLATVTGFGFVWGSTFALGDEWMVALTGALATPWQGWLPATPLTPEVISATRYYASASDLSLLTEESRAGWWWFLFMCMACYALLPRLVLWVFSRVAYRRELQRAFVAAPGAAAVLSRMRAPAVRTQALEKDVVSDSIVDDIDEGVMLLNWAQAVSTDQVEQLPLLARVPSDNRLEAGLGAPTEDTAAIEVVNAYRPELLLISVKAWEPPMADLADVLAQLNGVPQAALCLVPLAGREVSEHDMEEWLAFAHELDVPALRCEALRWG